MRTSTLGMLLLSLSLACSTLAWADAVTEWNENAGKATLAAGLAPAPNDPVHEARLYAMMHLAMHDALNAITRRFEPYALDLRLPAGASPEAAVATHQTAADDASSRVRRRRSPSQPNTGGRSV